MADQNVRQAQGELRGPAEEATIMGSWTRLAVFADVCQDFETVLRVIAYGTFCVDATVADAINSQYPELDSFFPRVEEERGCIINLSSVVGHDPPARCLTYGPSKSG
jgi:3-hydroxyacyl-CoA dehydrogenase